MALGFNLAFFVGDLASGLNSAKIKLKKKKKKGRKKEKRENKTPGKFIPKKKQILTFLFTLK